MLVRLGTKWFVGRASALAALRLLGSGRLTSVWRGTLRFERTGVLLVARQR